MRPFLFVLLLAAGVASAGEKMFTLKSEERRIDSMILRDASRSPIPFDKTYAQLSPEQKEYLHSKYENIAPGDEPPFPLKGMKNLHRGLQEAGKLAQVSGMLDVRVMVGPDGKPQVAHIYQTPDMNLARAVAYLLMTEQYKPALCAGQPCAQEFQMAVMFEVSY